jgi:hypothetical protein
MMMKKASGGDSPLWQGAGKSFWTLPITSTMAATCSMFSGKEFGPPRVFSMEGINRRKGDVRGWTR